MRVPLTELVVIADDVTSMVDDAIRIMTSSTKLKHLQNFLNFEARYK